MPIPKGVDPKKYAKIEDAVSKKKGVKNKFALVNWIAKRKAKKGGKK